MDPQDVPFGKTRRLCKDKVSAADYTPISHTEFVYGPPKELRFVGLYVSCQDFSYLGGLYESEGDGVNLNSSSTSL